MTDLTDRIAELAALIDAGLAQDEAAANAAALSREIFGAGRLYEPEWATRPPGWEPGWEPDEDEERSRWVGTASRTVVYDEGSPTPDQAEHIARNDPARALRRVKATRDLVAVILAEQHADSERDSLRSCSQVLAPHLEGYSNKPCDCGRDSRVARLLGIIATEWEG